jgi:P2-related tail formation protein
MSTPLRGTHLIDLCTSSISYDRQVQSACKAFDRQMFSIIDETGQVIMVPNIMNLKSETLVDILAWQFHVDLYDPNRSFDFRKRLVQMSILWHMTKGTVALVQEVLDTYWPDTSHLEEWFQYKDPFPPNYPIDDLDSLVGTFDPGDVNLVTNRISIASHGLSENSQIRFRRLNWPLPRPLLEGVWYYAVSVVIGSFKVSHTFSGEPLDLTEGKPGDSISEGLPPDVDLPEIQNEVWRRGAGTWHDRYKFRILIDDMAVITPDDYAAVFTLVNRYKPVSRWCEGIFRVFVSDCNIGWMGMILRFVYREVEAPNYP